MRSIRTKITTLTVSSMVVIMVIAAVFGVVAIRNIGISRSEQLLKLLCEAGQRNLDDYFEDVEQDVQTISAYVESDMDGISDEKLQAHLDRVSDFFKKVLEKTDGVKTYYYRIDPSVSADVKGFWYVDLDGEGFREHEVTDITQYDTDDTSQLVWFTVPKASGKAVWLPPYITDNLDVRVISYNTPVYLDGQFVGVIGIELDYSALAEQVDNITLFENGYAFVTDESGKINYHPNIEINSEEDVPAILNDFENPNSIIRYNYEGEDKLAVWMPLINGDHLNVSVPLDEINADWQKWVVALIVVFAVLLVAYIILVMKYTGKITKPLTDLTKVAEKIVEGDYDCDLDYDKDDEIGTLTRTFKRVTSHLKAYISDLNDLAYADALTSLHNKGAFDICIKNMQIDMEEKKEPLDFAVCIFDCNNLKTVNDENGHDKGDIYLKDTAEVICEVFEHSPVFRIGGDEFAAVLMNTDYVNRDELIRLFDEKCAAKRAENTDMWEQVDVARGMAVYNPDEDKSINDVVRRADRLMYDNKWQSKRK